MSSDELAAFMFYRMEMPASGRRRGSRHLAPRDEWHRDIDITLGERQSPSYRSFYGSGSSVSSCARDA